MGAGPFFGWRAMAGSSAPASRGADRRAATTARWTDRLGMEGLVAGLVAAGKPGARCGGILTARGRNASEVARVEMMNPDDHDTPSGSSLEVPVTFLEQLASLDAGALAACFRSVGSFSTPR